MRANTRVPTGPFYGAPDLQSYPDYSRNYSKEASRANDYSDNRIQYDNGIKLLLITAKEPHLWHVILYFEPNDFNIDNYDKKLIL